MATQLRQPMNPVEWHGADPILIHLPEAASQTFVAGELVFLDGGYVKEIASNTPATIVGVAQEDGNNGATDGLVTIAVAIADPDKVFVGNVTTNGNDVVTAVTDVGKTFGIYRDTTNSRVYVDKNVEGGSTNTRVIVIQHLSNPDAVGDTNGRVYFRFLSQFCQLSSTS